MFVKTLPILEPGHPIPSLSTKAVGTKDRVDYWKEMVCDRILPLEFAVAEDEYPFDATLRWEKIGDIYLSEIHATPHIAHRTPWAIGRAGSDSLVFNFLLSGCGTVTQDGKQASLEQEGGAFCNAARPYTLHFGKSFHLIVVQIPKRLIAPSLAGLDRATAYNMAKANQLYPIVMAYLAQLVSRTTTLDLDAAKRISNNLSDLIAGMIAESLRQSPQPLSENKTATLIRIRAFVEKNLSDPDLNPLKVSQALRLSTRHINQLLEAEGTSLGRLIWERRLEHIAAALKDSALASRTISAIALEHGFNDSSHFSKAFRQKFKMSPRQFRVTC